jgi:hypothetical protein
LEVLLHKALTEPDEDFAPTAGQAVALKAK